MPDAIVSETRSIGRFTAWIKIKTIYVGARSRNSRQSAGEDERVGAAALPSDACKLLEVESDGICRNHATSTRPATGRAPSTFTLAPTPTLLFRLCLTLLELVGVPGWLAHPIAPALPHTLAVPLLQLRMDNVLPATLSGRRPSTIKSRCAVRCLREIPIVESVSACNSDSLKTTYRF